MILFGMQEKDWISSEKSKKNFSTCHLVFFLQNEKANKEVKKCRSSKLSVSHKLGHNFEIKQFKENLLQIDDILPYLNIINDVMSQLVLLIGTITPALPIHQMFLWTLWMRFFPCSRLTFFDKFCQICLKPIIILNCFNRFLYSNLQRAQNISIGRACEILMSLSFLCTKDTPPVSKNR